MTDWENIRYFVAVAQSGTLSGAARKLKVDHATVSRRLAALESALGIRLVDRLPRSCRLTAAGAKILEGARQMELAAQGIDRLARAVHPTLSGPVVLSAPPVLVAHLFAKQLGLFQARFPEIRLSVSAQGRQVSLKRREADLAVRLVRPSEPDNVARKIGTMEFGLYASPAYAHLGTPEEWRFIAFDENRSDTPQQRWLLGIANGRRIACELNHISEHLTAAQAGAGLAGLPRFLGDSDPALVRILEGVPEFARDIWLVVHADLRNTPAVRAVMDFITDVISEAGLC